MTTESRPPRRAVEDFHFGARVVSSDGRHIGSLNFMIVGGESFDVHAIVVKETHHFSGHHLAGAALMEDDIAIPVAAVGDVGRDQITLSSPRPRRAAPSRTSPITTRRRARGFRPAADGRLAQTGFAPHMVEEAQKRLDELEIHRGENVMLGATGRRLGTVQDVVLDEGELAGVVIRPAGFFTEDVLLQVRFLGRSDDLALFAHLTEADVARLTPFHPGGNA